MDNNKNRIILVGGGTMGSVSPLIAIWQELQKKSNWDVLFVGTKDGPEKKTVEALGIPFQSISSGKLRRYFSFTNLADIFRILRGVSQSKKIIRDFQPDIILTAGSFVCVPFTRAAAKLNVPYFIHQQDIVKGLANKLMEKKAAMATITFDTSLNDFNINKTNYTSNPTRLDRLACSREGAYQIFQLNKERKTILVLGGGTGASAINQLVLESLGQLTESYQILHSTGKGKSIIESIGDYYDHKTQLQIRENYWPQEYLEQGMCEALKVADVVVTRAGLSSLTELSILAKPIIIIPIPDSHQEANAQYFAKYNAGVALDQKITNATELVKVITNIMENTGDRESLSRNISQIIDPNAAKNYVDLIYKFLQL